MSCPLCGKPVAAAYRPFCSRHCADLDLARWLNGRYSTPSTDPEDIVEALEAAARAAEGGVPPSDDGTDPEER